MTSRYFIIVCLLYCNLFVISGNAQNETSSMHVMERLIQIKYNTELMLIQTTTPHEKDSALVLYNTIRWQMDGLIYSIAADMISKNNLNAFKILQKIVKHKIDLNENDTYKWLDNQWALLTKSYEDVKEKKQESKNINLTTNVFYIIKDSWSFLEGIQKIKSDKIKTMVDLLDQTRLRPPLELFKK